MTQNQHQQIIQAEWEAKFEETLNTKRAAAAIWLSLGLNVEITFDHLQTLANALEAWATVQYKQQRQEDSAKLASMFDDLREDEWFMTEDAVYHF